MRTLYLDPSPVQYEKYRAHFKLKTDIHNLNHLNPIISVFSKAMQTIQQERFDEFGYTYVAPR